MSIIHQLDQQLINQIAAGEVIERPASVVKELLENAIDADATEVRIDLVEGGLESISVADNGKGMSPEDLRKSVLPHTTSKIKNTDDLFAIQSLGFRGEALASIASVSHMQIASREANSAGNCLDAETAKMQSTSCPEGTVVTVCDIFHNTPARKKYMRRPSTEMRRCMEVVQAYALAYPQVGLTVIHNQKEVLNIAAETPYNRIVSVLGKETGRHMIPVEAESSGAPEVSGYIGKPETARKNKRLQYFFINKRLVSSTTISAALGRAFQEHIHHGTYPVAVLHIDIPPRQIDVNVHPTKAQIRFSDEQQIFRTVYHAVQDTLSHQDLSRQVQVEHRPEQTLIASSKPTAAAPSSYQVSRTEQVMLQDTPEYTSTSPRLPSMRILGVIHATYIVAEDEQGMVLIDFHAAHERINYEKLKEQVASGCDLAQELVQPIPVEVDPAQYAAFLGQIEMLGTLGFRAEAFGDNTILVRGVPCVLGKQIPADFLPALLEYLEEHSKNPLEKVKDAMIARMACRMSLMSGDELSKHQMYTLIEELHQRDISYSCPHGRPVMIRVTSQELEKMFERRR
ncbi:MAG: DNA mismatch repair endonuclease MutL [Nanoarchaeota archaeon]